MTMHVTTLLIACLRATERSLNSLTDCCLFDFWPAMQSAAPATCPALSVLLSVVHMSSPGQLCMVPKYAKGLCSLPTCKLSSCSHLCWLQGTWAALASHAWSHPAQILVKAIADRLQQHNLKLVSRAYATIGPNKLAAILGMTPDAAVQGEPCLWGCNCAL